MKKFFLAVSLSISISNAGLLGKIAVGAYNAKVIHDNIRIEKHNKAVELYKEGKEKEALNIWENLCNKNMYESCFKAGLLYLIGGSNIEQNKLKSAVLLQKACENNIDKACEYSVGYKDNN